MSAPNLLRSPARTALATLIAAILVSSPLLPGIAAEAAVVSGVGSVMAGPVTAAADVEPDQWFDGPYGAYVGVSGTAQVGKLLAGDTYWWDQGTAKNISYTYRWLRNGEEIAGETTRSYRLTQADLGSLVEFEATGSAPGYYTQTATNDHGITIAGGTASLSGLVTGSASNAPIAGIVVTAYSDSGDSTDSVTTGADGRYSLGDLDDAHYTLTFAPGPGVLYADGASGSIAVGTTANSYNAVLQARGGISGSIRDSAGNPIPGAEAYLLGAGVFEIVPVDAQGNYSYTQLPAGTYTVKFFATGFVRQLYDNSYDEFLAPNVTVTVGSIRTGISARMARAGSVSGVVTGSDGLPVEGVSTELCGSAGCTLGSSTDADGAYRFDQVIAGNYTLRFSPELPYVATTFAAFVVGDGEAVVKNVSLTASATITGRVVNAAGAAIAGAFVYVYNALPTGGVVQTLATDAQGRYSATVPPGAYSVRYSLTGYTTEWSADQPSQAFASVITVASGEARSLGDTTLTAGVSIFGTVTGSDTAGVGVAGVQVKVYKSDVLYATLTTDAAGRYVARELPVGAYKLQYTPPAPYLAVWWNNVYLQTGATVITTVAGSARTGGTDVTVAVPARVSGTVTGDGGAAVAGVVVVARSFTAGLDLGTATTDASGNFSIAGLRSGSYGLSFTPPTGSPYAVEWWNDRTTITNATAFALTVGQNLTGMGVSLGRTLTSAVPTISGSVVVGEVLSATSGTWAPAPVNLATQWYSGGVLIAGATGSTYTSVTADVGKAITVAVTGTATGYNPVTVTSAATAVIGLRLTGAVPTIAGTTVSGSTLTATPGTWAPTGATLTYRWNRDGVAITGNTANKAAYVLVAADIGKTMTVDVTGTLSGYVTSTVRSLPTATVLGLPIALLTAPAIAGSPTVGTTLTATAAAWSVGTLTVTGAWTRNGTTIAAGTTYTLVNADAGTVIAYVESVSRTGYQSTSATSAATAMVSGGTFTVPQPTIDGTAAVGSRLTAVAGTWSPAPTGFSYEWLDRNGAVVHTDTSSTFTVPQSLAGDALTVRVTATRSGFTSATSPASAATSVVTGGLYTHGEPTIAGDPVVGTRLEAVPGAWSPSPASFVYQWQRDGVDIQLQTAQFYTLTNADAGAVITVRLSGVTDGFELDFAVSDATAAVTGGTQTPGAASITGAATVGSTLVAHVDAWNPTTAALEYVWHKGAAVLQSGTSDEYLVAVSDAGESITVTVNGTAAGYDPAASLESDPTDTITGATFTPGTVTISGSPAVGGSLTAVVDGFSPEPASLDYVWTRGATVVQSGASANYSPVEADAGSPLAVTVTASRTGYTDAVATASTTAIVVGGAMTAATPTISGDAVVGQTLTAHPGEWKPTTTTFAYAWIRDGVTVGTLETYELTNADAGSTFAVEVTGSAPGFVPAPSTSAATDVVTGGTFEAGTPTISGTPAVGETLTANTGVWNPTPARFGYQWTRDGDAIAALSPATTGRTLGAETSSTGPTYVLVAADLGARIGVIVTADRPGFTGATATSEATAAVVAAEVTPPVVPDPAVAAPAGDSLAATGAEAAASLTTLGASAIVGGVLLLVWRRQRRRALVMPSPSSPR